MERKQVWLIIAILLVDLGLLLVGVFGAKFFGSRILSLTTASIGIVTFIGLLVVLYKPGLLIERAMRNAIAGSMITTYLSIVGMTTFFSLIKSDSDQILAPLTKTMIDSFQSVIMVVIGFYFTASAAVEGIQRFKTGNATGG